MWEKILEIAATNGIWAVLFVVLLVYLLQDSKKREDKYQKTIERLTERLEVVAEIKEKVDELTAVKCVVVKKKGIEEVKEYEENTI